MNKRKQPKGSTEKLWYVIPALILTGLITFLLISNLEQLTWTNFRKGLNSDLLIFLAIGIFAQLVDGTMGMGYGATSTSFLLAFGVPPVASSMAVHVAEMFSTGASALSHFKYKNVNKKLVMNLLIPGVMGSVVGAYVLTDIIDGKAIKPFIACYMIILALLIIRKGLKSNIKKKKVKRLQPLALFGGFMDAVGGGGWGPIVTSSLMGKGRDPRYTIGSVNTTEFGVAFASGITFILFEGINHWQIIIGLVIGGIIAAPVAASVVHKIPRKPMTLVVGVLLILLSLRTIIFG
ncbi:sulfite exporter TauE/SafE family protein [Jiulongibacter sediminis]|uniref:Probable membrane transporter protein n=1 Tax=Jiulongibacter sediminis TaxID=1605367 RepID=A0A0P7BCM7_9BACT|nr:sulfite exporter TauE/SafE family protein [Jiulongibacter sediminis]KPM48347.1 ABC transporter permease [Jiulongibacter sediminis]TBX24884.1 ABC transporter permease [Jiulongibacter sediminis]